MTPALLTGRPTTLVPAPPEDATRREFITGVGAAALAAAFLAACGEDAEGTPTPATTIDFVYEDIATTIPRDPKRVVVMEGRGDLDFALSAGYPILATGSWIPGTMPSGPFEGRLDGVELLPDMYTTRDYEALVRLQPDLIVQRANAFRGDFYGNERLAQIAPVLSIECNRANWRADLEAQAQLLDRDQQVGEQLAAYDQAVRAARDDVGALLAGRPVAMTTVGSNLLYIWTSTFATEVGNDLGLEMPFLNSSEGNGNFIELSAEGYGRLEGVDLIWAQNYSDNEADLVDHATWSRLPAAQAGRVLDFPGELNNGMALTAATLVGVLAEGARRLA
jgi:iron complex transport system substrate-binding protein